MIKEIDHHNAVGYYAAKVLTHSPCSSPPTPYSRLSNFLSPVSSTPHQSRLCKSPWMASSPQCESPIVGHLQSLRSLSWLWWEIWICSVFLYFCIGLQLSHLLYFSVILGFRVSEEEWRLPQSIMCGLASEVIEIIERGSIEFSLRLEWSCVQTKIWVSSNSNPWSLISSHFVNSFIFSNWVIFSVRGRIERVILFANFLLARLNSPIALLCASVCLNLSHSSLYR